MADSKPISPTTAYLLMSLTALFWGGNFVIGRAATGTIPPLTLAWARWTGASLLILPFVAHHLWRDWPQIRQLFCVEVLVADPTLIVSISAEVRLLSTVVSLGYFASTFTAMQLQ